MTVQRDTDDVGVTWVDDSAGPSELFDAPSSSYPPQSLVTFRFLADAVRRHSRLWIRTALLGLIVGLAVPIVIPSASVSSVKLLLIHRAGDDPVQAMATDISLLSTNTVAQRTIDELGLTEATDELLDRYDATALTDRVMEIKASASSSEEATQLAATVADIYLAFRAEQVALQEDPLQGELEQANKSLAAAREKFVAAGGDPEDPDAASGPEATRYIRALEGQRYIEQQILDQQVVASRLTGSRILDTAAPVEYSKRMALALSAGTGLVAGMLIGLGFVVVRALLSDKLWKRQDIAVAFGVPVRLSIGQPPRWRWRPFPRYLRRSQMQHREVQVAVQQLRTNVLWNDAPKPALAVVGVDNVDHTALIVASLATSFAEEGWRVLVADLSGDRALGVALGKKESGTYVSRPSDAFVRFTLYVPESEVYGVSDPQRVDAHHSPVDDEELDAAWADADVVLTLATLSPALGAEHLKPWSSRAVAVVTAGKSTATELRSVSELVRLAGLRLDSALVLRTDRTDVSVGVTNVTPTASEPTRG